MNCHECRDHLIDYVEGLLEPTANIACRSHLETCTECRKEERDILNLCQKLEARGRTGSEVSLVAPVMRRIHEARPTAVSHTPSPAAVWKWVLGLGAATATAALAIAFFMSISGTVSAAEIMARGAEVVRQLTSVHLTGRVRSAPAENFSHLDSRQDFTTVQVWKEFAAPGRWRIEKPGRVAVMDGQATELFIRSMNEVFQVPATPGNYLPIPGPTQLPGGPEVPEGWAPFDTGWLHQMANIEQTLTRELDRAQRNGWAMNVSRIEDDAGQAKMVVSIEAKSGLPSGDYLLNKFFSTADTLREYTFDAETGFLEDVRVFLHEQTGDVLVFEVDQIVYNAPHAASVFELDLPDAVVRDGTLESSLPEDPAYSAMTAEQAARAFFEACGRNDWDEVGEFWTYSIDNALRNNLGGLSIVHLGESFTSAAYPGRFVPYEIRLHHGQVRKHNLAFKRDRRTQRWYVDGGI